MIAGADVRHVPLVAGSDFFEELNSAIINCLPKPKMLILNFPGNPTSECVDLDFLKKLLLSPKSITFGSFKILLMQTSFLMAIKRRRFYKWQAQRCGSRIFLVIEKLQYARLARGLYVRK